MGPLAPNPPSAADIESLPITSSATSNSGGSVVKSGGGTLTLSGANTYTGSTTVSGGTLSYGGSVAGTGSGVGIVGISIGTLTLAGANTYTGSTILGGSLSLGGSGASIGGTGVVEAGSGTLTLTGANTYGGSTTISGGSISLGGSGTGTLSGSVGGTFSGTSSLLNPVMANGNTLVTAGNISSAGPWPTVMPPATIGGSSSSGVLTSGNGATLTLNNGTIGGTALLFSGASGLLNLADGYFSDIGEVSIPPALGSTFTLSTTLNIVGQVTQAPGGILCVQVDNSATDANGVLNVTGDATLNGLLEVKLAPAFTLDDSATSTYDVVNVTGTLSGTFSNAANGDRITTLDGLGSFQVNYTANGVILSNFEPAASTAGSN